MALTVQTNNAAMTALKNLNANSKAMDKSLERLSSGFRVNNAADDASGYAVASKLDGQTQRLKAASLNASQAQAMTKMADAGVNEIQNMVVRIQTLATQASSANNAGELGKLDAERIKLESAIDKIANSTNYNGVNLMNGVDAGVTFDSAFTAGTNTGVTTSSITTASGTAVNETYTLTAAANGDLTITNAAGGAQGTLAFSANATSSLTLADGSTLSVTFGAAAAGTGGETNTVAVTNQDVAGVGANTGATYAAALAFQVGADNNANNQVTVDLTKSYTTAALGLGTGDLTTQANAQAYIDTAKAALNTLVTQRADLGATQNQVAFIQSNIATSIEQTTASVSSIRDADMAAEMADFTKNKILTQASTSMLAQANQAAQNVMTLFR
ncbi:flagellin N-terminal helical domain-containing protein [Ghiorsea bivora]|uniref:flagellin N-terminal helical domain-containing protein n=1 Tax=Ghiorsea bivora TaxID=1485545 RepID=UPI00056F2FC5|nr:flagellin [Ghiorsea bivora]